MNLAVFGGETTDESKPPKLSSPNRLQLYQFEPVNSSSPTAARSTCLTDTTSSGCISSCANYTGTSQDDSSASTYRYASDSSKDCGSSSSPPGCESTPRSIGLESQDGPWRSGRRMTDGRRRYLRASVTTICVENRMNERKRWKWKKQTPMTKPRLPERNGIFGKESENEGLVHLFFEMKPPLLLYQKNLERENIWELDLFF